MRQRASVMILRDQQLLLIKRQKHGETYYTLPGGGIEAGETPEQAAHREIKEELGVEIQLGALAGNKPHQYKDHPAGNWIFWAGLASHATPSWQEHHKQQPDNQYEAVWRHINQLGQLPVKPDFLAELLVVE